MGNSNGAIVLQLGDATLSVPAEAIARALLGKVMAPQAFAAPLTTAPKIGEELEGGIYAGISVHDNQPVHLVLLPGEDKLNWKDAIAWAEKQGGVLPSRIDQLVLCKNLKGQFQEAWYWSGEQCAGNEGYAWYQPFGDGGQLSVRKDVTFRARAVRRLVIQ